MLKFIFRRLLYGVILLFVITFLAYILLFSNSSGIARNILGPTATQQQVAAKIASLGLNRPLLVEYWTWLRHALSGNLGTSWFSYQPVTQTIIARFGVTLTLVIGATLLTAVVSVLLGVLAALKRGFIDRVVQVLGILGFAIPGFIVALLLVTFFALDLHWFTPTGYTSLGTSLSGWIKTVTLPVVALSIGSIAGVAQQIRGSVIDALGQDYVRTLRTRGLSSRRIVFKHVLRNAGGPALTVLALQFVGLLGGVVIVESIFAIPGIGQIAVDSTTQGDIPLVMGLVVASAIIVVTVNLMVDIGQGLLNPKVRRG